MKSAALTVKDYLAEIPKDRRAAISAVRDLVNRNLPKGYREQMSFGMIAWCVPLEFYPDTHNGQPLLYAALSSQKQYMCVYLMTVHGGDSTADREFHDAFTRAGMKLDVGSCCVRFKKLEDLHLPAIGKAIARCSMAEYVRLAKEVRGSRGSGAKRAKPAAARPKPAAGLKKVATKAARKPAARRAS